MFDRTLGTVLVQRYNQAVLNWCCNFLVFAQSSRSVEAAFSSPRCRCPLPRWLLDEFDERVDTTVAHNFALVSKISYDRFYCYSPAYRTISGGDDDHDIYMRQGSGEDPRAHAIYCKAPRFLCVKTTLYCTVHCSSSARDPSP